jgi:hypothetical protein
MNKMVIKEIKEYDLKRVNATRMALTLVLSTLLVIYCAMSAYTATDMRTKLMESSTRGVVTTEAIVQMMERYGHTLKDPSFDELTEFLIKDDTNNQNYTDDFVCTQFTAMLISNALVAGWNCAVVEVLFYFYFLPIVGSGHAMVAFNTTDHGTVFVEPQSDGVMSVLKKGDSYFNQQILDVKIIWCKNA